MKFTPVARHKTAEAFRARLEELSRPLGAVIGCDDEILSANNSPLARAIGICGRTVGNRFCIHPMEGWDGHPNGMPSEWTLRRWRNFGLSGAKLIWGGEALAVDHAGRANPNQLFYSKENERGLADLLAAARGAHRESFGSDSDLLVGLQLTHSGRFARPNEKHRLEPRIAQPHPRLDARFGADPAKDLLSDVELDGLIGKFVVAAAAAANLGFDFVDIKHCHGYLLHELLGAKLRSGRYGGSFENRTRFLRDAVAGIRREAPGLMIGVRLSAYDQAPPAMAGEADGFNAEEHAFGLIDDDLTCWRSEEPIRFLELCRDLGLAMVNVTAGSPYYCAHIQRPAAYPPVDSTESTREDPLLRCVRQLQIVRELKAAVPEMSLVGTAYSYFQEYLPHVAQAEVRSGGVDFVGLGRMVLSYPTLPADILAGREPARGRICRTFSDCTNGPRMGFISGCFPLDPEYKALPEWKQISEMKKQKAAEAPSSS